MDKETIAVYVTIATPLVGACFYLIKAYRTSKTKERATEKKREEEVIKYRRSGNTLPGRTDLGFFALLEISTLKTALLPHVIISGLCFQAFMTILIITVINDMDKDVLSVFGWAVAIGFGLAGVSALYLVAKRKAYIEYYERTMCELWEKPLESREKKAISKEQAREVVQNYE